MPSKSTAERRFMAICEHHPEQAKRPCPKMSKAQLHDFAATPEKGLPHHVADAKKSAPKRSIGTHGYHRLG